MTKQDQPYFDSLCKPVGETQSNKYASDEDGGRRILSVKNANVIERQKSAK